MLGTTMVQEQGTHVSWELIAMCICLLHYDLPRCWWLHPRQPQSCPPATCPPSPGTHRPDASPSARKQLHPWWDNNRPEFSSKLQCVCG